MSETSAIETLKEIKARTLTTYRISPEEAEKLPRDNRTRENIIHSISSALDKQTLSELHGYLAYQLAEEGEHLLASCVNSILLGRTC